MHILVNLWLRGSTSLPVHLMRCHLICPEKISFYTQSDKNEACSLSMHWIALKLSTLLLPNSNIVYLVHLNTEIYINSKKQINGLKHIFSTWQLILLYFTFCQFWNIEITTVTHITCKKAFSTDITRCETFHLQFFTYCIVLYNSRILSRMAGCDLKRNNSNARACNSFFLPDLFLPAKPRSI